ncbi:NUDIX domain-containing protein [Candidatus Giovannonibacteria bacterium]|nr:NUDIX domain-containing protein [Candidatus Giovannonibacteria bacterium]
MGRKPRHPVLSQKALVVCRKGDILLVRRSKFEHSYPRKWEFPGGKIEPGASLRENLVRELGEELGKRARIKEIVEVHDRLLPRNHSRRPGHHVIILFFRVLLEDYEGEIKLSGEHSAFRWVSLEAALKVRLPPGSRKALKRFRELRDKS